MAKLNNTNSKRGNFYKKKTKQWFLDQGYDCEYVEKYVSRFIPGKGIFHSKKDTFGADGVSMNGQEIIFWNSKATLNLAREKNGIISKAEAEFKVYKYPLVVKRWVVIWEPRVKNPLIVDCK